MTTDNQILKKKFDEFDNAFPDGRLTAPSSGKRYDVRAILKKTKELGRALTDEEAKQFEVN